MIKSKYLILILMTLGNSFAQSQSIFDSYLIDVLNLDYKEAEKKANRITDRNLKNACWYLSQVLFFAGQAEISKPKYENDTYQLQVLDGLSVGYQKLFSEPYESKAFQKFVEAYEIAKKTNNDLLIKFSLLSIIQVYNFEISQTNDLALVYLNEFKKNISNEVDEYHYKINYLLYRLRDIHFKDFSSEEFELEFEALMRNFDVKHKFWPNYLSTLAVLLETRLEHKKSIEMHKQAIESIGDTPFLKYIKFRSFIRLSEIYRAKKQFSLALVQIDSATSYLDNSDSLRSKYYINFYSAKNYFGKKSFEKAYISLKKSNDLSVELDYQKNSMEISRLNAKYQTAEKEKQILEEQQKARRNRNWLIAAGLVLLFGAGIAILLQKNTTKKRLLAEQEALLKQQRVDNLLKAQELVSIDAMIEGQEKERQRVANELHDDLGSLMATIKLHFDKANSSKTDPAMQHAQKLLEEAYQKVRSIAHHKNSGVMSDQGLLPAIKKMATVISETNALQVTVEDFGMGERLENSLELNLFRMVQELVANTIKHAEASKVTIQLTQHEDNLNIIVEDNGKGFERSQVDTSNTGMGLTTIEKRVEHLEGNFTVDSIPGKGTSILIDIPV
ncbi:ATP-binding protein [uncultured Croceitalea sp.]|uniref:ATP-binding protein n=1 Tax=uncultured Croceitalea sp. TaxID=1798908 RepID=UPI0033063EDA